MTTNEFSKLIKERRNKLYLTQKELAQRLSVSNKTVSRWETGIGYPDIETIPKLARILELNYEELLDGNEYIAKKEKQKKKRNFIILMLLCCILIVYGFQWYEENKSFESNYVNKDLLISGDMINKVILNYQEPTAGGSMLTYLGYLDAQKSAVFLNWIYIDQLIKIPNKEVLALNLEDFQWKATLHFDYQNAIVLKVHIYTFNNRTYFLFNQSPNYIDIYHGDLYYYEELIEVGLGIFADNLNNYNFNHIIKNKSDLLICVDQEIQLALLKDLMLKTNFMLEEGCIVVTDRRKTKLYLILVGESCDYQEIKTIIKEETLNINLKTINKLYFKKYINILEIVEKVEKFDIKEDNKSIPFGEITLI